MIKYTIKIHSEKILNASDIIKKNTGSLVYFYVDVLETESNSIGFVDLPSPPHEHEIGGADIVGHSPLVKKGYTSSIQSLGGV